MEIRFDLYENPFTGGLGMKRSSSNLMKGITCTSLMFALLIALHNWIDHKPPP